MFIWITLSGVKTRRRRNVIRVMLTKMIRMVEAVLETTVAMTL